LTASIAFLKKALHACGFMSSDRLVEGESDSSIAAQLEHCTEWACTVDAMIVPSPPAIAAKMISAHDSLMLHRTDAEKQCAHRMVTGSQGTLKTEFKSPLPPNELSFQNGAAVSVATFIQTTAVCGAAATSVVNTGFSGSSIHVHVNVVNPSARGSALNVDQILAVWVAWVKFDLITSRWADTVLLRATVVCSYSSLSFNRLLNVVYIALNTETLAEPFNDLADQHVYH
jgi:hypothetical protein